MCEVQDATNHLEQSACLSSLYNERYSHVFYISSSSQCPSSGSKDRFSTYICSFDRTLSILGLAKCLEDILKTSGRAKVTSSDLCPPLSASRRSAASLRICVDRLEHEATLCMATAKDYWRQRFERNRNRSAAAYCYCQR
nr:hypothetical protein CFP56_42082 [Quercus suber]